MGRPKGSKNGKHLVKIKSCEKCNKEFVANYANSCKVRFCSFSCSNSLKKGRLGKRGSEKQRLAVKSRIGEQHQRWIADRTQIKGRHQRGKHDPESKRLALITLKRDNYTCQLKDEDCGGRLEVHHILRWRDYPDLRYAENNLITLCHEHHPRTRIGEDLLVTTLQKKLTLT